MAVALLSDESLRYVTTGKVAHVTSSMNGVIVSLCGIRVKVWYGTGSQQEYEKAARLRLCRGCAQRLHECLICHRRAVHKVASLDAGVDGYLCHEHKNVPVIELAADAQAVHFDD